MVQYLKNMMAGKDASEVAGLRFAFSGPLGTLSALLLILALGGAVAWYYWPRLGKVPHTARIALTALRALAAMLVLFLLLGPCLIGERKQPGEQALALLFDNTKSMRIAGVDGQSRGDRLLEAYGQHGTAFEEELQERFEVVRYAFSLSPERIPGVDKLAFEQPVSDLSGSIENALRDLSGAEVAAVVLFSDGVQQPSGGKSPEELAALRVPIFTVGTDTRAPWRDLELSEIAVNRTSFDKSPVVVTARVHAEGLNGEDIIAEVLDEGRVVTARKLRIQGNKSDQEARMEFIPTREGWISYNVRVRHAATGPEDRAIAESDIALPGKDRVTQNNSRRFLVDNRKKQYRVLYLAGSPSWQCKFFRRALEDDTQIRLTTLVRVSRAEKTFVFRANGAGMTNTLFQGVDGEPADQPRYDEAVFLRLGAERSELTTGYPDEADELFPFDLVLWDDIEHNFFSSMQLEVTREYVRKRGGTLLLLGGPRSFAEGGFGGTLIDAMLPVVLRAVREGSRAATSKEAFAVHPTLDGIYNGAWTLDADPEKNKEIWAGMPELYGLNAFPLLRAGASVMARVDSPNPDFDGQPFFAIQRYGEGRCAVLASGETWEWRMRSELEDTRHERLWRQIVRSLVDTVPQPVVLRNKADRYTAGEPVTLETFVRDARFEARDGINASLALTTPAGDTRNLPVEESIRETGLYTSEFTPASPGEYRLNFTALDEHDEVTGTLEERLTVDEDRREFQNARFNPEFLERLASATGGRALSLEDLPKLAAQIPWNAREAADANHFQRELWYWPPFLAILALMLSVEWYVRRKRGQP